MVSAQRSSLVLLCTLAVLVLDGRITESVPIQDETSHSLERTMMLDPERDLASSTASESTVCQLCYHSIYKVFSCRLGSTKNGDLFGTHMIKGQTDPCYQDTCCASDISHCCVPETQANATEESCDVCHQAVFHVEICRDGTAMNPDLYGSWQLAGGQSCYEYTCCAGNMEECCISAQSDTNSDSVDRSSVIVVSIIFVLCAVIAVGVMIRFGSCRFHWSSDLLNESVIVKDDINRSKHAIERRNSALERKMSMESAPDDVVKKGKKDDDATVVSHTVYADDDYDPTIHEGRPINDEEK